MTEPPLRLICAWCKRVMREGPEPTSHGICPACAEAVVDGVAIEPCDRCGDDGRVRVKGSRSRVICPYCGGTRVVKGSNPIVDSEGPIMEVEDER